MADSRPRGHARAFGILTRGAARRAAARGPLGALVEYLVLPATAIAFLTVVAIDVTRRGGWAALAAAAVVWLLFAYAVARGGTIVWSERRFLDGSTTPPWLLALSTVPVLLAVYAVQLTAIGVGLAMDSDARGHLGAPAVLAALLALPTGFGLGLLVARGCRRAPRVIRLVPAMLAVSLLVTPVLYPLSRLGHGDATDVWCGVNPLCVATVLARADVADAPVPLPDWALVVGMAASAAVLALGLGTTRRRRSPVVVRSTGPALVVRDVGDTDLSVEAGEVVVVLGDPDAGIADLLRLAAGRRRAPAGAVEACGPIAAAIDPDAGLHSGLTVGETALLRALEAGVPPADAAPCAADVVAFARLPDRAGALVTALPADDRIRLAFAAAVRLTAPVVVWDDDLARRVPEFRQDCLALLPTLREEGRAILVGSGDLGKAAEIGPRAVWLEHGRIRAAGPTPAVLAEYLAPRVLAAPADPAGVRGRVTAVALLGPTGAPVAEVHPGDPITVAVDLEVAPRVERPYLIMSLADAIGTVTTASMFLDDRRPEALDGAVRVECRFEGIVLAPRHRFTVRFAVYEADGHTTVVPKRVLASFVTGGTAAECGFTAPTAEGRILGAPPVVTRSTWRLPDDPPLPAP